MEVAGCCEKEHLRVVLDRHIREISILRCLRYVLPPGEQSIPWGPKLGGRNALVVLGQLASVISKFRLELEVPREQYLDQTVDEEYSKLEEIHDTGKRIPQQRNQSKMRQDRRPIQVSR